MTTTYLINRLPTKISNFQPPIKIFTILFPTARLLSNIPLKFFGSIAFVHNHDPGSSKLDPKAHRCIFVGYPANQRGYKCFDPISIFFCIYGRYFFFKVNPTMTHLQEGYNSSEDEYLTNSDITLDFIDNDVSVQDVPSHNADT